MRVCKRFACTVLFLALAGGAVAQPAGKDAKKMEPTAKWSFTGPHSDQANYPKPRNNAAYDLTPPGFCWWRVIDNQGQPASPKEARYILRVCDANEKPVYETQPLDITAHVPVRAFPPGQYKWTVDAVDAAGKPIETWQGGTFTIRAGAFEQPWVSAKELLSRVPREHPRCIFLKKDLPAVRETLKTTRKEAFDSLIRTATNGLKSDLPVEPTFGAIGKTDQKRARMIYHPEVGKITRQLETCMNPMALAYVLTGEKKYGEKAKDMLLEVVKWDPAGVTSLYEKIGHGPALRILRSVAETYDWLYDLMTEAERAAVKKNLLYRGNEMLKYISSHDFTYKSGSSHDGRLICYLGEFAVALAEEPDAEAWLDYSNRGILTVFPHWGGEGGGWNEGMSYGLAYNNLHTPPMTTVSRATGFDLWRHPYFSQARYFFMYCVNLRGEIRPFGDGEQGGIGAGGGIASLLLYHANTYNDPTTKWWIRQFVKTDGSEAEVGWQPAIYVEDKVAEGAPDNLPPDRVFPGIGWVALHSELAKPDTDLHVLFKSSPYGSVSHAYADQNTYVIMKGGKPLASVGGAYWPTYGAPFHDEYTRQTISKNGILVNGKGQICRKSSSNGEIVDFRSTPHLGYACGEAVNAYGGLLTRFRRHVLLARPGIVLVVDDLAAPDAAEYQWLFQTRDPLAMAEGDQRFVSSRKGEAMTVYLYTPGGFDFHQTDEWPVEPTKGYEDNIKDRGGKVPDKQWHFTATTREKAAARRIAAVMLVNDKGTTPTCVIRRDGDMLRIEAGLGGVPTRMAVDLSPEKAGEAPILDVECAARSGEPEKLVVR